MSEEERAREKIRGRIREGLEAFSDPGLDGQSRRQGREYLEELTAFFEEEEARELRAQIRQTLGKED